ncbi:MAG: transposase, partial [Pseudomonadota bacterium]
RLLSLKGIGVVTASALVATVGNAHEFSNGRQFAAWLGLTPRQNSTGGRSRLGRISKRGDSYLRTLLIHGARSEMTRTKHRSDAKSQWVENLRVHKPWNKVAVALANKNARVCWHVLAEHPA